MSENWAENSVFYQFYPFGVLGAEREHREEQTHRVLKLMDWTEHLSLLQVDAVYFSPVFDSDSHGYDTRDYTKIDGRIGTNDDFAKVCAAYHAAGIRIVLDGVFHHVGRGFFAFRDVQEKKWDSPYKDWFYLDFGRNSAWNDGFYYEGWEGCYDLVKLNLSNPQVREYLFAAVRGWIHEFDIDGLRLDVAYLLPPDFLAALKSVCRQEKADFWLCGEMLHGDYNRLMNEQMLDSVTNYECYKGLYSSMNCENLFEIMHSLKRQFGADPWTLYRGKHLLCFVDNHDVTRVASVLTKKEYLIGIYTLLFTMPGIPCIYYGSEWGQPGRKEDGDWGLRPMLSNPQWNALTDLIARLAYLHHTLHPLAQGDFTVLHLQNRYCAFERRSVRGRVVVCVNISPDPVTMPVHFQTAAVRDEISGETYHTEQGVTLGGYGAAIFSE